MSVFLYGTLRYEPLLRLVLGVDGDLPVRSAMLAGHAVRWAKGESFPLLIEAPGERVEGLLLDGVTPEALARADYYEAAFGYVRETVTVECGGAPVDAEVYVPPEDLWQVGKLWDLVDWAERWGKLTLRAADEVMGRFGVDAPEDVGRNFMQTRMRAASWVRARGDSAANHVRAGMTEADVASAARRRPYRHFFMVEEQDVSFRQFGGGQSETVTRAAFVMGDAVTVVPYDPVRDRVLLIEQFRFGPFARGDLNPWSIEPIAGRIDPGEDPVTAAMRETQEEAGLTLDRLEQVARYYPSPGAITEYLYSYVGLADLPDDITGIGGVEEEAEDIRSFLLDFDEMMEFLTSGEAENGPLILTLHWLAANRSRLRGGA
ncbi:gamma-glutamylcyclotransferase [Pseudoruegeria sp. HB172150]|uniref:gamma-glutamylcyclotransferase n=1 Tax=Pseudoruegeria sp. HB172150 TaxID=2721164 RepID=UPI0015568B37|nr:gamma-glutamylcyclotransferase [Pseudoruegeria sp. HB172150]